MRCLGARQRRFEVQHALHRRASENTGSMSALADIGPVSVKLPAHGVRHRGTRFQAGRPACPCSTMSNW